MNEYLKLGIYIHKKNGSLAIVTIPEGKDSKFDWNIDKGRTRKHPFFRIKQSIFEEGQGEWFFQKSLKQYEFLNEY